MKPLFTHPRGAAGLCAAAFACLFTTVFSANLSADTVVAPNDAAGLEAAASAGGIITFTSGGTFNLPQGLHITRDTVIDGSSGSTVIRGNGSNRVIYVDPGVKLTLLQVSINNGYSQVGGGIYNAGTVLMSNVTLSANSAVGLDGFAGTPGDTNNFRYKNGLNGTDGFSGYGGAIFNTGAVLGTNVTFANNIAKGGVGGSGGSGANMSSFGGNGGSGGAGGYAFGGAIFNSGILLFSNASFSGNSATSGNGGTNGVGGSGGFPGVAGTGGAGGSAGGGAVYTAKSMNLFSASFVSNSVTGGNSQPAGPNNNAPSGGLAVGGAIYNTGSFSMLNSTLSGNLIKAGHGAAGAGGAFPRNGGKGGDAIGGAFANAGYASLSFCTVASNASTNGVGGTNGTGAFTAKVGSNGLNLGANIASVAGSCSLDNSIFAYPLGGGANVYGYVLDAGYNISSDLSGPAGFKSRRGLDPALNAIATLNSNRTAIMTLKKGSPAINTGNPASLVKTDQIGQARGVPDIGAAEYTLYYSISGSIIGTTQSTSGVRIKVLRNTFPTNSFDFTASNNGPYTIANLLPGQYTLSVTNSTLTPTNVTVSIVNSNVSGINFTTNSVPASSSTNSAPPRPVPFALLKKAAPSERGSFSVSTFPLHSNGIIPIADRVKRSTRIQGALAFLKTSEKS